MKSVTQGLVDTKIEHVQQFEKALAESSRRPAHEQLALDKTFLNRSSSRNLHESKVHHHTLQA